MSDIILIVDDEQELVDSLSWSARREGFVVRTASTGAAALAEAQRQPRPDLVLLDLMLPDIPGTEVCRQLRADAGTRDIAIIMCTARGDEIDRVVGFELGADDYVTKPFSPRELMLRVRAILRRARPVAPADVDGGTVFGRLRVQAAAHTVWVDQEECPLTALEYRLLTFLLDRRGRVQSREVLLDEVWDVDTGITTRTVDTHIKRLRGKLRSAGAYIETRRGFGYRMCATPPQAQDG